jgi:hypothetical protein
MPIYIVIIFFSIQSFSFFILYSLYISQLEHQKSLNLMMIELLKNQQDISLNTNKNLVSNLVTSLAPDLSSNNVALFIGTVLITGLLIYIGHYYYYSSPFVAAHLLNSELAETTLSQTSVILNNNRDNSDLILILRSLETVIIQNARLNAHIETLLSRLNSNTLNAEICPNISNVLTSETSAALQQAVSTATSLLFP